MTILQPVLQPVLRPLLADPLASGFGDGLTAAVKALFASGEKGVMLDFTKAANLYTDSARTTPVTSPGDKIGSVTDLSGNEKHASSTSSMRPSWDGGYATFDAFDDYMQTATIDLSGTNKATVVACIRKSSDSASGMIAETSSSSSATAGTFGIFSSAGGAANYRFQAFGSSAAGAANATTYTAPITNVIYCIYDLSKSAILDVITPRVDGAAPTLGSSGSVPGVGSFTGQALNIGSRNAVSTFFNGRIYRLLVIGRALTTTERNAVERWAAQPAGISIP